MSNDPFNPELAPSSPIQAGKLSILEHFWRYSSDNIFIVALDDDDDFVVEDINPAQAKNLRIVADYQGKKLKQLVSGDASTAFESNYRQCLAQATPLIYDESIEVNGRVAHWNTMIIPVLDAGDGKARIFGIAREMTALIEAKRSLANINQDLEQVIAERTMELQQSNQKLKAQSQRLEQIAYLDPLTQIGNRRHFFMLAEAAFSQAQLNERRVSIIYADLDDFKRLNDTLGHAGDNPQV